MKAVSRAMTKLLDLSVWKHLAVGLCSLIALVLLVIADAAMGATWRVTYDPGSTADRIGQVVRQAASGDSIVVGPGTYYEHIDLKGKALVLLSTDGPSATVLDGSSSPAVGSHGCIVYSGPFGTGAVVLSGFTLQHGSGGSNEVEYAAGGAICLWNPTWARGGAFEISDCIVTDNSVPPSGYFKRGGGIYSDNLATTIITQCAFSGNRAYYGGSGGAVCLIKGRHTIKNCSFVVDEMLWRGAAAYISTTEPVRIEGSQFTSDGYASEDWCIFAYIGQIQLVSNTFMARSGSLAARLALYSYMATGDGYTSVELTGNQVFSESESPSGSVDIVFGEGIANLDGNTFVNCSTVAYGAYADAVNLRNNILFHSPTRVASAWYGGTVSCNDAWPDSVYDPGGNFTFDRNVSADPLFCELAQGSFGVLAASICAEGNSPAGCGWIGAGRIGCSGTPVRPVTWGQIKALFR
jgi:hypothetical protein